MKKVALIHRAVVIFLLVLSACLDDSDDGFGGLGQLCYGDRSCDPGLRCRGDGTCVTVTTSAYDAGPQDLRDDGGNASMDAQIDDAGATPCWLNIVELESLAVNEYWAACPGESCEDDRSDAASANGHLVTYEYHTSADVSAALSTNVVIPAMGNYWIWARSARTGPGRGWGLAIGAYTDDSQIGVEQSWQRLGPFALPATSTRLSIRDISPDALWAYPDVVIVVNSEAFAPTLCAEDGIQAAACANWCDSHD